MEKALASVKTPAESATLSFGPRAQLASAEAWSPNPKNPPLYLDLPVKDGVPQPDVLAKWAANAPLAFVDHYVSKCAALSGDCDGCGRSGRIASRRRQAARGPGQLWNRPYFRGSASRHHLYRPLVSCNRAWFLRAFAEDARDRCRRSRQRPRRPVGTSLRAPAAVSLRFQLHHGNSGETVNTNRCSRAKQKRVRHPDGSFKSFRIYGAERGT